MMHTIQERVMRNIKIGDTVSIDLLLGGRHEGVVTGSNRITARSNKYNGVTPVTFDDFANGKPENIVNHGLIGKFSRQVAAHRATSREGEIGYNLIGDNCIHFTNEVNGLPRHSRMGQIVITACLAVGIAYFAYKNRAKFA